MGYQTTWQVRFGEVDRAGVIYYPTLFDNVHRGIEDLLADAGYPLSDLLADGVGLPVVHAEADYFNPARFGDTVALEITPTIGDSSITFEATGRLDDPVFRAVEKHVAIHQETFETRPVPSSLREALAAYAKG